MEGRIDLPIACSLEGPAFDDRARDWGRLLAGVVDKRRIAGGIEFRFLGSDVRDRLQALVDQEHQCCPWMSMRISEREDDLSLSISSDDATGERQIHDWFG